MARSHIYLPDPMMAEVDALCAQGMMVKSKFIQRAVQMALDDARRTFGSVAANETVSAPALPARSASNSADLARWLKRGDATWFLLDEVCAHLGITTAALLTEIDEADDVLQYLGSRWIDATGIKEARAIAHDTAKSDSFWLWAQTKIPSPL